MVTLNLRDDCNGRVATNFKRGMTDKRFLELEITAWLTSPERKKQLEGEAYYDGYQDVTHRERLALDEDGKPIVLKNLPNNRLVNNLYSKMVDQKTNYSLAVRCPLTPKQGVCQGPGGSVRGPFSAYYAQCW